MATKLLMTLPDYERAFQIIHAILLHENADISGSCAYFAHMGAAILRAHYRVDARAVTGMALLKVDGTRDIISFASLSPDGYLCASEDAFHCWVEAEGLAIDFSAPLFAEMFARVGKSKPVPRKMLQRPETSVSGPIDGVSPAGSFLYQRDPDMTNERARLHNSYQANLDFQQIAASWFAKKPKRIHQTIGMGTQTGAVAPVSLSTMSVSGAW